MDTEEIVGRGNCAKALGWGMAKKTRAAPAMVQDGEGGRGVQGWP